MSRRATVFAACILWALASEVASAQEAALTGCETRSLDDAWWTGPMLANSASTLPRGHVLVEPYLYDATSAASFDSSGGRHAAPRSNGFGSLTYLVYGLTDRVGVALVPTAGYNTLSGGPSSSGLGLGDWSVLTQYRLTQFRPCRRMPTISVAAEETFPSGKYDELGDRQADGLGSGAYTTTLSLYTQTSFWLPTGRILRLRLNASEALSSGVNVDAVSVYGTDPGFRGQARPGRAAFIDMSWEYSLTRSWVLAVDATYRHAGSTGLTGSELSPGAPSPVAVLMQSGASETFALAPALEYSWTSRLGVLLGLRVVPAGRNTAASVSPAIAINFVR